MDSVAVIDLIFILVSTFIHESVEGQGDLTFH